MIIKHIDGTEGGFFAMNNHAFFDETLSLKARGFLAMMVSLPDDWEFSVAGFSKCVPDGKAAISGALKELESAGYVKRTQSRGGHGQFGGAEWIVSDLPEFKSPLTENPMTDNPTTENRTTGNPTTDKPMTENRQQLNNHLSNKHLSNKQESNKKEQPVFDFPIKDGTFFIAQKDIDQWQDVFPGVDVVAELKKMRLWCEDNPAKRKSQSGARRFVSNWLNRANSDLQSRGKQYANNSRDYDESEESIYDQFAGEVL